MPSTITGFNQCFSVCLSLSVSLSKTMFAGRFMFCFSLKVKDIMHQQICDFWQSLLVHTNYLPICIQAYTGQKKKKALLSGTSFG
jgi:hypothetical protein